MSRGKSNPQENEQPIQSEGTVPLENTNENTETGEVASEEDILGQTIRERDEFRSLAQRAQADFINYKRRMEEDKLVIGQVATSQLIVQLFPVLDDFERALAHLPPDAADSWTEGVQMILRKLEALLETEGITSIDPNPGTTFDPNEHEAVHYEQSSEHTDGSVMSTFRRGYRNSMRVLRPAQVVVSWTG